MESKKLLKVEGFLFSPSLLADEVEDLFYQWLEDSGIYYCGFMEEKKDIEE